MIKKFNKVINSLTNVGFIFVKDIALNLYTDEDHFEVVNPSQVEQRNGDVKVKDTKCGT